MIGKNIKVLFIVAIAALIIGAAGSTYFFKKESGRDLFTLRTTSTLGNIGITDIAEELGYFREAGIKLERVGTIQGGSESIQALAAGSIDIGQSALPPYINSILRGAKLKAVVAGVGNSQGVGIEYIVLEDSSIRTAKDLIGKKIAVNVLGAEADYVIQEYLQRNGISKDQVQLVVVPWPQHEQVLRSKQVDMVAVLPPFSNILKEKGGVKVLFTNYEIRGETAVTFIGMREDFIKKNPEIVKNFVSAVVKADDWAAENPEEAKKIVEKILQDRGDNPSLAKYWKPPRAREHSLIVNKDVQWWIDWYIKDGKLKESQIKPSDLYTNEFNPYYKK